MKKLIFIIFFIIVFGIGFYLHSAEKVPFLNYQKEDIEASYETVSEEGDYYMINTEKITSNAVGRERVNKFIEEYASDFKQMAETSLSDAENNLMAGEYSLDIKIEDYSTDQYISYVLRIGEYTGGANMNQSTNSLIFNRDNKEELTLSEMVDEDFFMDRLRTKLSTGEEEGNFFPGVSEEVNLQEIDSFYITSDELVVLFSKYKIAPGVAGIVEISLDKKGLLK